MARGLLLGLVIGTLAGLALGWVLFNRIEEVPGHDGEPVSRATSAGDAPLTARAPAPHLAGSPAAETESAPHAPPDVAPPDVAPPDVAALAKALGAATEAADWVRVRAALEALGAADTPEADALLVKTLGNPAYAFPEPMGIVFLRWLEGTRAPGVSEAVRRRIPADVASMGISQDLAVVNWAPVLGAHGSEADLDWLLEEGGDKEPARRACQALLESGSPAGLALARTLIENRYEFPHPDYVGGLYPLAFHVLADADPEWVRPHLEEEIHRAVAGPLVILPTGRALAAYVETFACADAARAHEVIFEVFRRGVARGSPDVQSAFFAVRSLDEAGCDVEPLEEIIAWPADTVLALAAAGGPRATVAEGRSPWGLALRLLQDQELAWTRNAVAALEAALPFAEGYGRLRLLQKLQEARRHRR